MEKFEGLLLIGTVYKKKQPKEYTWNGQKGFSYYILVDTGDDSDVYTLKVKEDLYNEVELRKKYVFECVAVIDDSKSDNRSMFYVSGKQSVMIDMDDNFKIVSEKGYRDSLLGKASNKDAAK